MGKIKLRPRSVILSIIFIFGLIFLILIKYYLIQINYQPPLPPAPPGKLKPLILLWTTFWSDNIWELDQIQREKLRCEFTNDKNLVSESHAVIFHMSIYYDFMIQPPLPSTRSQDQIYIAYIFESPHSIKYWFKSMPKQWNSTYNFNNNYFNWTASYRSDSEAYTPLGEIVKIDPVNQNDTKVKNLEKSGLIKNKSKLIAWMASHCETSSNRENIVKQMASFIKVDIFGKCSSNNSNKNKFTCENEDCYQKIGREYKFYIAAENSLCTEYVTEKLFKALAFDLVPVVYGGADYTSIAPTHSYINVDDFETIKDLTDYLIYLDNNPEEYLKFFEWKTHFRVELKSSSQFYRLNTICEKLIAKSEIEDDKSNQDLYRSSYSDLINWWESEPNSESNEKACKRPLKINTYISTSTTQVQPAQVSFSGAKKYNVDNFAFLYMLYILYMVNFFI